MQEPFATHLPVIPPDAKRRAVLLMDSGTEVDKELINTFRKHVPKELVDIIVVSTVPKGWDGALEKMASPAHPNIYNPWLFDSQNIDHMVLVEEDESGHGTSIQAVADAIRNLDVDVRGILPNPLQAWNEVGIAKLAQELGIRHAPVASVEICQDKIRFNDFLRKIKEEYKNRGDNTLNDLYIPEEKICTAEDESQRARQIHEDVRKLLNPPPSSTDTAKEITSDLPEYYNWNASVVLRNVSAFIDELTAHPPSSSRKIVLKPTDENGGSIGVIMISSDDDDETIEARISEHLEAQRILGSTKSSVQEFVPNGLHYCNELGIHFLKNGDETTGELTMKIMTNPPNFKEIAHFIPRASIDLLSRHQWEAYQQYQEKVFPVIEALFKELDIDVSHLNADIRITPDGKICIHDIQLRTGLGVPKMLNAAYDDPDFEAKRMFMGMDLFSEHETDSWLCAKHAARAMRHGDPEYAVIVTTNFPSKTLMEADFSPETLERTRRMKNIFHLNVPGQLNSRIIIPPLTSYMSIGHRPQVGATGKTIEKALVNIRKAFYKLGFKVFIIANDENNPDFQQFKKLVERKIIDIDIEKKYDRNFYLGTKVVLKLLQVEKLTPDDWKLIASGRYQQWYKPILAPERKREDFLHAHSSRQPTIPRWNGENPPPYTFVRQSPESKTPKEERWCSSRPPTLREKKLWQSQVKISERSRGQSPKL